MIVQIKPVEIETLDILIRGKSPLISSAWTPHPQRNYSASAHAIADQIASDLGIFASPREHMALVRAINAGQIRY